MWFLYHFIKVVWHGSSIGMKDAQSADKYQNWDCFYASPHFWGNLPNRVRLRWNVAEGFYTWGKVGFHSHQKILRMSMSLILVLAIKAELGCHNWRGGGARGMCPPLLSDQLTLSQRGWENYAHNIIMCPSDFQTFLRPCGVFKNNSICGHDCDNFVPIDEVQTGPLAFEFNYLFVGYCCKRSKNCGVSNNLVAII